MDKRVVKPPTHCKFCGARLKFDMVGPHCPTSNCQWQHGLPTNEGGLYKRAKKGKRHG